MRVPEKIELLRESGETLNSSIVSIFMIPDTGKKYIITTENAVDPHGLTVLHVSEIHDGTLVKVEEDEEWTAIKTIMRAIISGNVGSYQYLSVMQKAKIDGQYSRDISVSSSAAKQMTDNYNAADKLDSASIPNPDESAPVVDQNSSLPGPSIFPENNVKPTEENEVSPGISDMATVANPTATPQAMPPAQENNNMVSANSGGSQVMPVAQNVSQPVQMTQQTTTTQYTQQMTQPVQQTMNTGVVDASGMVAQSYMDSSLNTPVSTMGVTAGYGTVAPMNNQTVYGYQQPYNLDAIVQEVQEQFSDSIRKLVYSVYEKVQNEGVTRQIMQQTMQQPLQQMQTQVQSMNTGYGMTQQTAGYSSGVAQPMVAQPMTTGYSQGYQQNGYAGWQTGGYQSGGYQQSMYNPMYVQASNDNMY